jgi:hypothetical protein
MQHILNRWIRYVESTGSEVSITLLVGGTTIVGFLTPMLRYNQWLTEVIHRTKHAGGSTSLPWVEMLPISPEVREQVRAEWGEDGLTHEGGNPDDPVEQRGPGCVIRNAEVRPPGPKMYWQTYPYLLVQVTAVDAINIGHGPTPSLPPISRPGPGAI